jgi:hypothetical protein
MLTQEGFYAMAKDRPEILRSFYNAVHALIEYRQEADKNPSGLWAKAHLKKTQFSVTFQIQRFASRLVFNGQPLSEEERNLVKKWIIEAANFHMLPKEEQENQLMQNVDELIAEEERALGPEIPVRQSILADPNA